jgi:cobalamin biosynthesis protein CobW
MAAKIPVTVVTGFLGSGKTTLIRHLLQNTQGRRIAVLVNEFGELGIDGEILKACQVCDQEEKLGATIVELTNGCLCCTVQEEFLPTMQHLLQRRDQLDCMVIETSGLALPKPLIQAFRWPQIRNGATVDGVVTAVDCEAVSRGTLASDLSALATQRTSDPSLEHETPLQELFTDQLACADLVLLTKVDLVDAITQDQIRQWLQPQLRPGVRVIACQQGQIPSEVLLGFNARVEEDLQHRPSHHDQEEDHDHDDQIGSVQCVLEQEFDPTSLVASLKELLQEQEIYRIKGFVAVPHKPMRLVLQGVGQRFDTFYDRPWQLHEPRLTQLVMIGRNLQQDEIQAKLDLL